jgi:hypothetical protein
MEAGSNLGSGTSDRRTAHDPLNLALDLEHAHVSSHIRQDELAARFPKLPFMNALAQMVGLAAKRIFTPCGVGEPAISGNA